MGYIVIKLTKNLERIKRKVICHIKGSFHKNISRFLSRNITGQKGVEQYIQSDERKIHTTNNTLPGKAIIQI